MSVTQPPIRSGNLAFSDARTCKEWLNALPLTNIPQAQSLVLEALRALNGFDVNGLERLKCMELLRDKVAFLQGEQRSRYFGKSLPLSVNDSSTIRPRGRAPSTVAKRSGSVRIRCSSNSPPSARMQI